VPEGVRLIQGDRTNVAEFSRAFERERFEAVIDMICYAPEHAEASVRAFAGRCEHFVFCSTAGVYGVKTPPAVLIDETCPLEPVNPWARSKVLCEQVFMRAAERGDFKVTIARPGHTYGPGEALDDQLERDSGTWDRVARGLPILCAGDGLGLWTPTHRDDCAKFFAYAALSPKTHGQAFNAMSDEILTWRHYYREAARALGTTARLLFVPASWLIAQAPERFESLAEMTQFHGAYSSAKAKAAVPEFRATIGLEAGARETFADVRRRGAWRDSASDTAYQRLVDRALAIGFQIEEA
jgi:nucleoside-diphosphate-sugar epimerase